MARGWILVLLCSALGSGCGLLSANPGGCEGDEDCAADERCVLGACRADPVRTRDDGSDASVVLRPDGGGASDAHGIDGADGGPGGDVDSGPADLEDAGLAPRRDGGPDDGDLVDAAPVDAGADDGFDAGPQGRPDGAVPRLDGGFDAGQEPIPDGGYDNGRTDAAVPLPDSGYDPPDVAFDPPDAGDDHDDLDAGVVVVDAGPGPAIEFLAVEPALFLPGETMTLRWRSNAQRCFVDTIWSETDGPLSIYGQETATTPTEPEGLQSPVRVSPSGELSVAFSTHESRPLRLTCVAEGRTRFATLMARASCADDAPDRLVRADPTILVAPGDLERLDGIRCLVGDLQIRGDVVRNANDLSALQLLNGNLILRETNETVLVEGLQQLARVTGDVHVTENQRNHEDHRIDVRGLVSLVTIEGDLKVSNNDVSVDVGPFPALASVGGSVAIYDNGQNNDGNDLTVRGLTALRSIGGQLGTGTNGVEDVVEILELDALEEVRGESFVENAPRAALAVVDESATVRIQGGATHVALPTALFQNCGQSEIYVDLPGVFADVAGDVVLNDVEAGFYAMGPLSPVRIGGVLAVDFNGGPIIFGSSASGGEIAAVDVHHNDQTDLGLLSGVVEIDGPFDFHSDASVTTLALPHLERVGDAFSVRDVRGLEEIWLPSLEQVSGDFVVRDNDDLEYLYLPGVRELAGDFRVHHNGRLPQCLVDDTLATIVASIGEAVSSNTNSNDGGDELGYCDNPPIPPY